MPSEFPVSTIAGDEQLSAFEITDLTSARILKRMLEEKSPDLFDDSPPRRLQTRVTLVPILSDASEKTNALTIRYSFISCIFGNLLVASTETGICHISFSDDKEEALLSLRDNFLNAKLISEAATLHQQAVDMIDHPFENAAIKLHLKCTPFQLKVWNTLLEIQHGELRTYSKIAKRAGSVKGARAAGNAIGRNPVAILIPCHRVIYSDGSTGNYMWGAARKKMLIAHERRRDLRYPCRA
jgi:AraC family transcriptional regulator of adaptative response/methylated-DNA-[protein]-cysteine methyltransferase